MEEKEPDHLRAMSAGGDDIRSLPWVLSGREKNRISSKSFLPLIVTTQLKKKGRPGGFFYFLTCLF